VKPFVILSGDKNLNGRIYPVAIWNSQLQFVADGKALIQFKDERGDGSLQLSNVAAQLVELIISQTSNGAYLLSGRIKLLHTQYGHILYRMLQQKISVYLVPDGMGTMSVDGTVESYQCRSWNVTSESGFACAEPIVIDQEQMDAYGAELLKMKVEEREIRE
jgi:hypothetical protein